VSITRRKAATILGSDILCRTDLLWGSHVSTYGDTFGWFSDKSILQHSLTCFTQVVKVNANPFHSGGGLSAPPLMRSRYRTIIKLAWWNRTTYATGRYLIITVSEYLEFEPD
jgi:hypothetical protein